MSRSPCLPTRSARSFMIVENAARHPRGHVSGFERIAGGSTVCRDDGTDRGLRVEAVRVDVHAELLERIQVGAPLDDLIGFLDGAHALGRLGHEVLQIDRGLLSRRRFLRHR